MVDTCSGFSGGVIRVIRNPWRGNACERNGSSKVIVGRTIRKDTAGRHKLESLEFNLKYDDGKEYVERVDYAPSAALISQDVTDEVLKYEGQCCGCPS